MEGHRYGGIRASHDVWLPSPNHQNQPSDHLQLETVVGGGPPWIIDGLGVVDELLVEMVGLDPLTASTGQVHDAVV